jgi:hypothetical protein
VGRLGAGVLGRYHGVVGEGGRAAPLGAVAWLVILGQVLGGPGLCGLGADCGPGPGTASPADGLVLVDAS